MKKRRRKKHVMNLVFVFWTTFIGVFLVGMTALLIYHTAAGKGDEAGNPPEEAAGENPALSEAVTVQKKEPESQVGQENREEKELQETEPEAEEGPKGKYADILADSEYMQANHIYAKETAAEGEVTLVFAGDILFDPGYSIMARMLQRANGIFDSISEDLIAEMQNADIFMVNNEFPYSDRGSPTPEKQFTFRAKPEYADILHDMGADIVSLANNHAYDYGEEAFLDTMDILRNIEMPFVGAGRNLEEASAPIYFIAGDMKIAVVSATQIERLDNPDTKGATETTPGVFRCWNPAKLLEIVGEAKENSDFVIVYIHWGTENQTEIDWAQIEQAPRIAEAGADLIIGDHPHCLQGITYFGDTPVIYSMGNFWFNSKTVDTGMVRVTIGKEGLETFQFLPALQSDCRVDLVYGEEKERILSLMRELSPDVLIDENGFVSKK